MNAIVLYDSKFGNTARIAQVIGRVLEETFTIRVQSIDEAPAIAPGLELLVLGGPTHAHGISAPMRTFLQGIPADVLRNCAALVFDTRFRMPAFLSGRAAPKIARVLKRKGAQLLLQPESFFVSRSEGHPLEPGEEERASAWARNVIALLAHAT
jgi:flavorubredoxin